MEITTIKCLLYCTKEKPYLTKIVELGKYYCAFKKGMNTLGYTTENELSEAIGEYRASIKEGNICKKE